MKLDEKIIAWSDGRKNTKFIPQGAEILKYIGSEMLMVRFDKDQETGEWKTSTPEPVFIIGIGDFEPLTGTYKMTYRGKETDSEELRITPEGFSWNVPENDGWMIRFVSYSNHFRIMEEELFYTNLKTRFTSGRGVLGPDSLSQFSMGKERKYRLGSLNYIAAVIDTDVESGLHEGILSFRISEVTRVEKRGRRWELGLRDSAGDYISVPKFLEVESQWMCPGFSIDGKILGDLKILDIESI